MSSILNDFLVVWRPRDFVFLQEESRQAARPVSAQTFHQVMNENKICNQN